MAFTFRQRVLFSEFIDLFQEEQKPISYITAAKAMGVSNSTCYAMLRKLEKIGCLDAVYSVSTEPAKRGRARVYFVLGKKAVAIQNILKEKYSQEKSWDEIKSTLIDLLESGEEIYPGFNESIQLFLSTASGNSPEPNGKDQPVSAQPQLDELIVYVISNLDNAKKRNDSKVLHELQATITHRESPLLKTAQILALMTIPAASNTLANKNDISQDLLPIISEMTPSREGMNLLTGIILGFSLNGKRDGYGLIDYRKYVQLMEELLQKMDLAELKILHEFTLNLWQRLFQRSNSEK